MVKMKKKKIYNTKYGQGCGATGNGNANGNAKWCSHLKNSLIVSYGVLPNDSAAAKYTLVFVYNGILFSNKTTRTIKPWKDMNET